MQQCFTLAEDRRHALYGTNVTPSYSGIDGKVPVILGRYVDTVRIPIEGFVESSGINQSKQEQLIAASNTIVAQMKFEDVERRKILATIGLPAQASDDLPTLHARLKRSLIRFHEKLANKGIHEPAGATLATLIDRIDEIESTLSLLRIDSFTAAEPIILEKHAERVLSRLSLSWQYNDDSLLKYQSISGPGSVSIDENIRSVVLNPSVKDDDFEFVLTAVDREDNEIRRSFFVRYVMPVYGSTRALLDAAATVVQLYSYDAYGNALGFDPKAALTEFLYSGEQFDAKIGQQYLRQRYYAPATGRFNRLDPFFGDVSDPQSLHKYTYVHGDPINMIDPSGLFGVGGIGVSMSIGNGMSGMRMYAAQGVRSVACGALSGALVGSIMGALLEACKHADMAVNGQQVNGLDASLSIIIGALEGAGQGMADGAKDGLKSWLTFGMSGRYDQMQAIKNLDKTYSEMIDLISHGKYFEATFLGMSTLMEIGIGPKLDSIFCFVDDTLVLLEKGEISEDEATTAIKGQIDKVASQHGHRVAMIMSVFLIGFVVQSHLKRKLKKESKYEANLHFATSY